MIPKPFALAGILALASLPEPASAIPVQWVVDYTNADGNVAVTGSFVYDADLDLYSAVDLSATDDVGISNATYAFVSPFDATGPSGANFRDREDADRTGERMLDLTTFAALTNAGGVISNGSGAVFFFNPIRCNDAVCGATSSLPASGAASRSTLTGTPILAPVPLPAAAPVLVGGLGLLSALRLRRRA